MKTNLFFKSLLVLCFFPFLTMQSQITITLNDMEYQDGEYYKMYSRDGSLWIVTGLTGKIGGPHTWDFSAGPTDSDYTFDYVLPSTTPCNADFPIATITEQKTGGGNPAYMYLDYQAGTGRMNYGICQPGTLPSPYVFNPPLIDFPSTIGFMDNWIGNTTFQAEAGGFTVDVEYDFIAFCNGYGTLTLPGGLGDFPCLQVSYLEHYKFIFMGTPLQESYIRSFYWVIPDAGITVIISSQEGSSPPPEDFDYSNVYSRMYESSKLNPSNEFTLNLTVFLEGPYNTVSGLMNTSLNPNNIPTSQPFNVSPWNYAGTESADPIPSVDIVDWVLIELRDATQAIFADATTRIAQQAVFILNDGSVVGMDGTSNPVFDVPVVNGLFAVVWHRNHLGVISASPIPGLNGVYNYNFSNAEAKALGGNLGHKEINPGVWGMIAGDYNADGEIGADDKTTGWMIQAGENGYNSADFNLNSEVNNPDKNDFWIINSGSNCQVPE
jgi:hypothetical protein